MKCLKQERNIYKARVLSITKGIHYSEAEPTYKALAQIC